MKHEILPLETRLKRLKAGYSAHVEYPPQALLDMAHTPLKNYFNILPEGMEDLLYIPNVKSNVKWEDLTISEAAFLIQQAQFKGSWNTCWTVSGAEAMAKPLLALYRVLTKKGEPA